MSAVRLVWHAGQALALGRPAPADIEVLRQHRDELLPLVECFGDVEVEIRPRPAPDWERIRMLMRCGRPARKRSPARRRPRP